MRTLTLAVLCLCALAARLPAEPPTGPYLLAVATASRATGIKGPQLGVLAGGRARVSDSIALLFDVSALHSPKIDAGDGYLLGAMLDVEHWGKRWYGALGASYAIQTTSVYSKEAWAPRLTIGRQGPAVRLSSTWQLPDSTPNRTSSFNLNAAWRSGRAVLRMSAGWLWHRDGDGWRLSVASGLDLRRRRARMRP